MSENQHPVVKRRPDIVGLWSERSVLFARGFTPLGDMYVLDASGGLPIGFVVSRHDPFAIYGRLEPGAIERAENYLANGGHPW